MVQLVTYVRSTLNNQATIRELIMYHIYFTKWLGTYNIEVNNYPMQSFLYKTRVRWEILKGLYGV